MSNGFFVLKRYLAIFLLFSAVLVVYLPALRHGFVWDDTALILRDPLIRSWRLAPEGFNHFLFVDATASDFYRPVQRLVYTLIYGAAAFAPAAYHLTSLAVHGMAAVALFCFAEELLLAFGLNETRRRWTAFTAALVWAVHPVHSSAVIYISGLADPLAAAFGFLGCYLILRACRATRDQLVWLTGAAIAFLASALSKESGLMFPIIVFALLGLLKRGALLWKLSLFTIVTSAVYFSLRLAALHEPAPVLHEPPPVSVRPINMVRAIAEYAGLIAFPMNLHMERDVNADHSDVEKVNMNRFAWRELQTLLGLALVAGVIYWAIRARKREPIVPVLLALAALSYLPVSGLVPLNATVAEHWVYVPSAFVLLAAVVECANLPGRARPSLIRAAVVLCLGWMAFLGTRTFLRTFDWKDQRTFLEHTIAQGGASARMLINLGGLELSEGKLDLAKQHLNAALKMQPDQPLATINLAALALKQNDLKTARELAQKATQMPLVDAQGYEILAVADNKEQKPRGVLRLHLATRTGTPNWTIEKRYILVLAQTGRMLDAIAELRRCLQMEWYRADSWALLHDLLRRDGQMQGAIIAQNRALAYDVHLPEHHLPF